MSDVNLLPDLVQSFAAKPRFYKDGNKDLVEISLIGAKDTTVKRVTPDIMARFRDEWNAYCDGKPMEPRKGTPLTTLPEINQDLADTLIARNLHTLEELAVLNDHQCQGLGHGLITMRKKAQAVIMMKQAEAAQRSHKHISDEMAKVGEAPVVDNSAEIGELKDIVRAQGAQLSALTELLTKMVEPRKPGRPRKGADGSKLSS